MTHAALGLAPGCGLRALKARWRELASTHHPDRGGDEVEFIRLRQAYTDARIAESICLPCRGSGKIQSAHGFSTLRLECLDCGGTGRAST